MSAPWALKPSVDSHHCHRYWLWSWIDGMRADYTTTLEDLERMPSLIWVFPIPVLSACRRSVGICLTSFVQLGMVSIYTWQIPSTRSSTSLLFCWVLPRNGPGAAMSIRSPLNILSWHFRYIHLTWCDWLMLEDGFHKVWLWVFFEISWPVEMGGWYWGWWGSREMWVSKVTREEEGWMNLYALQTTWAS